MLLLSLFWSKYYSLAQKNEKKEKSKGPTGNQKTREKEKSGPSPNIEQTRKKKDNEQKG